jgi:hypothetical protein
MTKMQLEEVKTGRMIQIYGPTGVGKTTTLIQTAPMPILYIQTEARSLKPSLDAANRPDLDIDVAVYGDFSDLIEFVATPSNFERHRTVIVDSYSHLMSINLSSEIENQHFESRSEKERQVKSLTSQTKLSQEGFGTLSSWMFRLTAALGRLSQVGKVVVVTALVQENPKWNRELAAAPALKGREFPVNMPGFFDLIGLVEPRVDGDGKIIYPPRVRFQSPDDSFVAKFTGTGTKTQGPLDINKILSI